ncbi:MAG TPA: serine/threonine-protein kinase, partial [Anaerolineales bacterium]
MDENLGVEVAVKDNLFTTEEYARQFRREAVILANLRHPNLPRVTDHFVMEGQGQYLVMDYIEGEDLRQRMDRTGVLTDTEAIVIGSAMCDALTYLGTRNPPIVHRDIKPGNVKISPQGQIFLVDFGLAKVLQGSQATTTGARAMTPGYSPPEQYGTARTDHRSDIFSLGATLYASLTGEIPEDALARAMEQTGLTPIRKHNSRVSRRLASTIEKSLAIRPDDRYQTAEEFKQALQGAISTTRRRMGEINIQPPPEVKSKPFPAEGVIPISPVPPVSERASMPSDYSPLPLTVSSPIEESEWYRRQSKTGTRRIGQGCWTALLIAALLLVIGGLAAYIYDPLLISNLQAMILPLPTQTEAPTHEPVVLPTGT